MDSWQQADLNLVDLKVLNSFLHKTNLCAAVFGNEQTGQCKGDSGEPLLQSKAEIGIASWSLKPCGHKPGVFTNVLFYADWILKQISQSAWTEEVKATFI